MKTLFKLLVIALVISAGSSCQKDEIMLDTKLQNEMTQSNQLKNSNISISSIDEIIQLIEKYVSEGILDEGISKSLISKLENAKKSLTKGNEKAASNQLKAVINAINELIEEGIITEEDGADIIEETDEVIVTINESFSDIRDGNQYETVIIGEQCWMAENLAYLPVVSSAFEGSTDEAYYYVNGYNGNNVAEAKSTDNYRTYGVLYNWNAANISCPKGWHLPSDEEWKILEKHLGMSSSDADDTWWRSSGDVGIKLKSISGWKYDLNGDNSSGFKALPGGNRAPKGLVLMVGYGASFWSSSEIGLSHEGWCRELSCYKDDVYRGDERHDHGN